MTGYTVHTGSTEKFSEGWDRIFSGSGQKQKKSKAAAGQSTGKKSAARSKKPKKK